MRIDDGRTRGLVAEPSLAAARPAAAWEENGREATEGAEREAREAREREREMGRKDTILAVVYISFLFLAEEKMILEWEEIQDSYIQERAASTEMVGGGGGRVESDGLN